MFNIFSLRENANQNNTEIPSHSSQNNYHQEKKQQEMLARVWEKGTLIHCWSEYKLVQPFWKSIWRFLKKLKIELPYDPAIPILGIEPKEYKPAYNTDTCTPIFKATLFTIYTYIYVESRPKRKILIF
jgi:hypothetical protein